MCHGGGPRVPNYPPTLPPEDTPRRAPQQPPPPLRLPTAPLPMAGCTQNQGSRVLRSARCRKLQKRPNLECPGGESEQVNSASLFSQKKHLLHAFALSLGAPSSLPWSRTKYKIGMGPAEFKGKIENDRWIHGPDAKKNGVVLEELGVGR